MTKGERQGDRTPGYSGKNIALWDHFGVLQGYFLPAQPKKHLGVKGRDFPTFYLGEYLIEQVYYPIYTMASWWNKRTIKRGTQGGKRSEAKSLACSQSEGGARGNGAKVANISAVITSGGCKGVSGDKSWCDNGGKWMGASTIVEKGLVVGESQPQLRARFRLTSAPGWSLLFSEKTI
jgi:hypothetical protein